MDSRVQSMRNEPPDSLLAQYETVRSLTVGLTGTLLAEDTVVQTMPDGQAIEHFGSWRPWN